MIRRAQHHCSAALDAAGVAEVGAGGGGGEADRAVAQDLAAGGVVKRGAGVQRECAHAVEGAAVVDAIAAGLGGGEGGGIGRLDGAAVVQLSTCQLQAVRSTCAQQRTAVGDGVVGCADVQPSCGLHRAGVGEVTVEGDAAVSARCCGGGQRRTGVVDQAGSRDGAAVLGLQRAAVGDAAAADRQGAVAQHRAVRTAVVQVEGVARVAQRHGAQALDQACIGQLGVGGCIGQGQSLVGQNLAAAGVLDSAAAGDQRQLLTRGVDLAAVGNGSTAGGRACQRRGAGAHDIAAVVQGVPRQGQRIGRIVCDRQVAAVVDRTIGNYR